MEDEEFVNWVNTYQNLFLPIIIHEIEPYLRDLTNWVNELGKPDAEKQRFLASGDYWLIAYAMAQSMQGGYLGSSSSA